MKSKTRFWGQAVQGISLAAWCENLEPRRLLSGYSFGVLSRLDAASVGYEPGVLAMDSAGDFFGITHAGGTAAGGSLFELKAGEANAMVLNSFAPEGGPAFNADLGVDREGDVFGTIEDGGLDGVGSVFEIPVGGSFTTIYSFVSAGTTGDEPLGTLLVDEGTLSAGGSQPKLDLYGISGGNGGEIFHLSETGEPSEEIVANLLPMYLGRGVNVARDLAGDLFTTAADVADGQDGEILEVPAGENLVQPFAGFDNSLGQGPADDLVVDPATGNLFGVTRDGGANGDFGTIYEESNGTITTLASFDGTDGKTPNSLIRDGQGDLFGTTNFGGDENDGSVFELPAGTHTIVRLHSFALSEGGAPHGLTIDGNGNLFGITQFASGGTGGGTIYELSPPPATQLKFDLQPQSTNVGFMLQPVTVELDDADGKLAAFDNSTVTLNLVGGTGLSGTTLVGETSVKAVNGVATFDALTVSTAGGFTLHATDGTLKAADSNEFAIGIPYIGFVVQPSTIAAGVKFNPQVAVFLLNGDGSGDMTAKPTRVTLTTTDPGGKVMQFGAMTRKGSAIFTSVMFKQAGNYTLAASAKGFVGVSSNAFDVVAGAVKKIVFTVPPPASVTVDAAFTVEAEVFDRFGNLATDDDSIVLVGLVGGPKSVTFVSETPQEVQGVVTINAMGISPPFKHYRLRLIDGKARATSKAFAVS